MNKNLWVGAGRVAKDPTFHQGESEEHDRLVFTLMVNRPRSEKADAITIVAWGKSARAGAEHIKKGKTLLIEGRINTHYNGEKNYFSVSASNIEYGPNSLKNRSAEEGTNSPDTSKLAAQLAAKARGESSSKKTNHHAEMLELVDKLVTQENMDYATAKKVAEEHYKTTSKPATSSKPKAKTASAPAVDEAPPPSDEDAPF